jgi:hypothetical protein
LPQIYDSITLLNKKEVRRQRYARLYGLHFSRKREKERKEERKREKGREKTEREKLKT